MPPQEVMFCLSQWLPALQAWPVRKHDNDGAVKHLQPIACMLFNSAYQEVISADEGGTICVWKVNVAFQQYIMAGAAAIKRCACQAGQGSCHPAAGTI